MPFLKRFWPVILCVLLFFAGRWTKDDSGKELKAKFEAERGSSRNVISDLMNRQALKDKASEARTARWEKDSLQLFDALQAQKRLTIWLKKENEKINYKNYSNPDMDSVDLILFGTR